MRRRTFLSALAAVAIVVMTAAGAGAREPVTRGDVQAQFEAVENGGAVISTRKGFETTIPPAGALLHSIRPIDPFFEGRRYCELDWHLVTIALIASPEELGVSTTEELKEIFLATEVTFRIDNVPTPATETTAVKTYLVAEDGTNGETFWRAWGIFYAPGVLSVGPHSLTGSATIPSIGTFRFDRITFHIDPAGSGACL